MNQTDYYHTQIGHILLYHRKNWQKLLYYTGELDIVQCPLCNITLCSWFEGDNALADHERGSPSCRFVLNRETRNIPIERQLVEGEECGYDVCGSGW